MTFDEIVAQVMERVPATLTSPDAQARIGRFVNQRYRQAQTSVSLEKTRRTTLTPVTVSGSNFITLSGCAKLGDLFDPTNNWVLDEFTLDQMRNFDATGQLAVGPPTQYAIYSHTNDVVTLYVYPRPNTDSDLSADCIAAGTDMEDDDEPTLPTDFHDILLWGALSDECMKQEKMKLAEVWEIKFQARLSDLRFFIAKSAYLKTQQTDMYLRWGFARRVWPYSYGSL